MSSSRFEKFIRAQSKSSEPADAPEEEARRRVVNAMSEGSSPAMIALGGLGPAKKSRTSGYAKNSASGTASNVR